MNRRSSGSNGGKKPRSSAFSPPARGPRAAQQSGFSSPVRRPRAAQSGFSSPVRGPRAVQSGFSSPVRGPRAVQSGFSSPSPPERGRREDEQWRRHHPSVSPRRMEHDRLGSSNHGRHDEVRAQRKRLRSQEPLISGRSSALVSNLTAAIHNRDDNPSRIVIGAPPPFISNVSNVSNVSVADGSRTCSALDGYGALVSRSLHLGDGTVRTYFSLPTDMGVSPAADGLNSSSYSESIPEYLRGEQWQSGRFQVRANINDGGNLFSRSDPNLFMNAPPPQLRPANADLDLPSQRYIPQTMYKEELPLTMASRSPFQDPDPKCYGSTYRGATDVGRPIPLQKAEKGFTDLPVHHHGRERPLTPTVLGSSQRGSDSGDGQTAYKKSPPPLPYNVPYDDYHQVPSAMYPRDVPLSISSRHGHGPQRDYGLSSYMEEPMPGATVVRTIRSPRQGETRSEAYGSNRGPLDRSVIDRKTHQNQGMAAGYHLDFDTHNDRQNFKRKYMGPSKGIVGNGNPDFKRRGSPYRDAIRSRTPEKVSGFGQRKDMSYTPHLHFERRAHGQRSRSPIRPPHKRERSPLRHRKGAYYDERSPLRPRKGVHLDDHLDRYHEKKYVSREGPHRMQKFPGASSERERTWHDRDLRDIFQENQEQIVAADLPEDSREFKQQVFRAYLRFSKVLNENLEEKKRYVEQGKAGTLFCLVCSRLSKPFLDTHSLVMHAYNSQKRGLRAEHLGLHKAVCTLMGWSSIKEPDNKKFYHDISPEEAQASKDDLIIWPPAIIIHDGQPSVKGGSQSDDNGNSKLNKLLEELGQANGKVKVVPGKQGHLSTLVVKYLATFSGLQEAEKLHQHFEFCGHGRKNWRDIESKVSRHQEGSEVSIDEKEKEREVLYGYLALSEDMNKVDTETQRRCVVRSRKEIDSIAEDPLIVEQDQAT